MKTLSLSHSDIYRGPLILVNAAHPYRQDAADRDLEPVNAADGCVLLDRNAAKPLSQVMDEINGWQDVLAVSGWRSRQEQRGIYTQSLRDNGSAFTRKFVALPGHSEHETGLAVDLGLRKDRVDFIRPDFPYAGVCRTFRQRSVFYGFIERYPKEKEQLTGIAHEPWHFRYVGTPHAEIMTKHRLCLEEYMDFMRQFPFRKESYLYRAGNQTIAVSYLSAGMGTIQFRIEGHVPCAVSGNNMDGYILTEWRQE